MGEQVRSAQREYDEAEKKYLEMCDTKRKIEMELSSGKVPAERRSQWVTRLKGLDAVLPKARKRKGVAYDKLHQLLYAELQEKQKPVTDVLRLRVEAENKRLKAELQNAQARIEKLELLRSELIRQLNATPVSMRA